MATIAKVGSETKEAMTTEMAVASVVKSGEFMEVDSVHGRRRNGEHIQAPRRQSRPASTRLRRDQRTGPPCNSGCRTRAPMASCPETIPSWEAEGQHRNQNYPIPENVDPSRFNSWSSTAALPRPVFIRHAEVAWYAATNSASPRCVGGRYLVSDRCHLSDGGGRTALARLCAPTEDPSQGRRTTMVHNARQDREIVIDCGLAKSYNPLLSPRGDTEEVRPLPPILSLEKVICAHGQSTGEEGTADEAQEGQGLRR